MCTRVAVALLALVLACGARTALDVPFVDAGASADVASGDGHVCGPPAATVDVASSGCDWAVSFMPRDAVAMVGPDPVHHAQAAYVVLSSFDGLGSLGHDLSASSTVIVLELFNGSTPVDAFSVGTFASASAAGAYATYNGSCHESSLAAGKDVVTITSIDACAVSGTYTVTIPNCVTLTGTFTASLGAFADVATLPSSPQNGGSCQ